MSDETITFDQVKAFLEANSDDETIKTYLKGLVPEEPITPDKVKAYLDTPDGKALIQPMMDKRVTEALDTYKRKTFDNEVNARVAAELLKRNPEETPEQKRVRELEENMRRMKEEQEMERLKSQIKDLAFKEGVSLDFIDNIPFTSVEQANLYIRNFKTEIENAKTAKVNELLASGYKPGAGNEIKSTNKVDLSKLSEKEMIEMEMAGELDKALGKV